MSVDTMARLAKLPRIVGVKDATADLVRPMLTRMACGAEFCQLSGEDATTLPFLAQSGHGCISVTANVAPRLTAELQKAWQDGDIRKAQQINERLMPVHKALFCESSPGPVKYALSRLGICLPDLRLPLAPIAESSRQAVDSALVKSGLLN
jgi:4-hydroxy-tetrahydrodipicolinate synthase